LIYLNAAFELADGQTVDSERRRPWVRQRPIVDHSLTGAQQDNGEVSNYGRDNLLFLLSLRS
jgi:hypothetical protein